MSYDKQNLTLVIISYEPLYKIEPEVLIYGEFKIVQYLSEEK